jgi:hypothetical protein
VSTDERAAGDEGGRSFEHVQDVAIERVELSLTGCSPLGSHDAEGGCLDERGAALRKGRLDVGGGKILHAALVVRGSRPRDGARKNNGEDQQLSHGDSFEADRIAALR